MTYEDFAYLDPTNAMAKMTWGIAAMMQAWLDAQREILISVLWEEWVIEIWTPNIWFGSLRMTVTKSAMRLVTPDINTKW